MGLSKLLVSLKVGQAQCGNDGPKICSKLARWPKSYLCLNIWHLRPILELMGNHQAVSREGTLPELPLSQTELILSINVMLPTMSAHMFRLITAHMVRGMISQVKIGMGRDAHQ